MKDFTRSALEIGRTIHQQLFEQHLKVKHELLQKKYLDAFPMVRKLREVSQAIMHDSNGPMTPGYIADADGLHEIGVDLARPGSDKCILYYYDQQGNVVNLGEVEDPRIEWPKPLGEYSPCWTPQSDVTGEGVLHRMQEIKKIFDVPGISMSSVVVDMDFSAMERAVIEQYVEQIVPAVLDYSIKGLVIRTPKRYLYPHKDERSNVVAFAERYWPDACQLLPYQKDMIERVVGVSRVQDSRMIYVGARPRYGRTMFADYLRQMNRRKQP